LGFLTVVVKGHGRRLELPRVAHLVAAPISRTLYGSHDFVCCQINTLSESFGLYFDHLLLTFWDEHMNIDFSERLSRALTRRADFYVYSGSGVLDYLAQRLGQFLFSVVSVSSVDLGGRGAKIELHELSFEAGP
jgi:hypothetical protein